MAIYEQDIAPNIWRNGEIIPWKDATIHVGAVGHASVSGILEGIKAYWNEDKNELYVLRLREHLVRFLHSIKMVRYGFEYSLEDLEKSVLNIPYVEREVDRNDSRFPEWRTSVWGSAEC